MSDEEYGSRLGDLFYEPGEYAEAVAWFELSQQEPKKVLNDDLALKVLHIARFGVAEYRNAITDAEEFGAYEWERAVADGEDA